MVSKKDKLMMELGYISVFVTNFDFLLHNISSYLINADNIKIGNFILIQPAYKNFESKIKLFKKLLEIIPLPDDLVKKANNNLDKYNESKDKRNNLIHGIWHTKDEFSDDEFYYRDIRKFDDGFDNVDKIDIKELRKLKEDLIHLVQNQFELNKEIIENYRIILENDSKEKNRANHLLKKLTNYPYTDIE
jgi:hypothetical protein